MDKQSQRTPLARRITLWSLIAVYTALLPSAIIIYRDLESAIGQQATGRIPLYAVIILGAAYTLYGFAKNKTLTHLLYLIPSALIASIIIRYQPNPNKHIHIPEYVLMAWLLYAALSKDYRGKGVFILIFLCGSLLGVVDELEQGLHPRRFYGWSDMAVNSSSTLIGIFTILGLSGRKSGDWGWLKSLREFRTHFGLILFGTVGGVLMCIHLFQVQAEEQFWGVYPPWLLGWNILFMVMTAITLVLNRGKLTPLTGSEEARRLARTAQLWIYPLLAILFYMYGIVVFISLTGISFR